MSAMGKWMRKDNSECYEWIAFLPADGGEEQGGANSRFVLLLRRTPLFTDYATRNS
jgi:hypothetical protein